MEDVGFLAILFSIFLSMLRVSVPLVFAAMGGIMSERSGIVNIALEGFMLVGAFAAATAAILTHSPWIGAAAGLIAGVALAAIYGVFVIQFRADQIVAGTAINMLAYGVTPLLTKAFFDSTGATPSLEMTDRFGNEPLFLALILVIGIAFWFKHSRLGLWLSFAGEHPDALSTAGIRVKSMRWFGVLASGALAGLGGVTLSIFLSSSFSRGMTAGRGFMALAALIFGKWKPIPTLAACLFFGLTDALQIRLQGVAIFGDQPLPVQFIQILPYLFTVLVLAGFMGKSRPPGALGTPWLGLILVCAFFTTGCDVPSLIRKAKAPTATVSPVADLRSPQALRSRENAELMAEMTRVVFGREPKDANSFQQYHASLNQGASLEGVLNGLTHSSAYREYEAGAAPAKSATLDFFVEELLRIQAELSTTDRGVFILSMTSGAPLARAEYPSGTNEKSIEELLKFDAKTAPGQYREWFSKSSAPTLRRVMIEALGARMEGIPNNTDERAVADWFSAFAARLAGRTDFGLPERNRPDADYHRQTVAALMKSRSPGEVRDRILWESLNRVLRIMNALESAVK